MRSLWSRWDPGNGLRVSSCHQRSTWKAAGVKERGQCDQLGKTHSSASVRQQIFNFSQQPVCFPKRNLLISSEHKHVLNTKARQSPHPLTHPWPPARPQPCLPGQSSALRTHAECWIGIEFYIFK